MGVVLFVIAGVVIFVVIWIPLILILVGVGEKKEKGKRNIKKVIDVYEKAVRETEKERDAFKSRCLILESDIEELKKSNVQIRDILFAKHAAIEKKERKVDGYWVSWTHDGVNNCRHFKVEEYENDGMCLTHAINFVSYLARCSKGNVNIKLSAERPGPKVHKLDFTD